MKKIFLLLSVAFALIASNAKAQSFQEEFEYLSSEKISAMHLFDKSAEELVIMKNAIFAKYGFDFEEALLSEYFSQYDWYQPVTSDENFVYSLMTPEEQYNVGRINMALYKGELINVRYSYYDYPYELSYEWLSISDTYGLSCSELRILRNAIYAHYGYIFKSDDLRYFFNRCSWYYPRYKSEAKVYGMMSKTEKHNIDIIKKREKQLGC